MRSDGMLRPMSDGSAASWIARSIHPFRDHDVGSHVPPVFEAYARILHPAWADDSTPVRWATVAAWSGGSVHARAEFEPMARERERSSSPRPFRSPPRTGELTQATLAAVCEVLSRHTATPDRCSFGVWEGYGWITSALRRTARLELPERGYLLFEGPLAGVEEIGWRWDEAFEQGSHMRLDSRPIGRPAKMRPWSWVKARWKTSAKPVSTASAPSVAEIGYPNERAFHRQSPNLIWPSDRCWFFASEIDVDSTFVGGPAKLIDDLLAEPRLEAWPAQPTDLVTADSDHINGIG